VKTAVQKTDFHAATACSTHLGSAIYPTSIGASSGNFLLIGLLVAATFLVLGFKWLLSDHPATGARSSLMISLGQADFALLESTLKTFLTERLKGLSLQSVSPVDGRVNLQYQYRRQPTLDWAAFVNELNQATAPATAEVFVG
jgi:hypothetical protein